MQKNASWSFSLQKIRVQAGLLKGLAIELPELLGTRPSKSILVGCVFSSLGQELVGASFIECFAGSAQMAVEALSHGAMEAFAIEKNKEAFKSTSLNIKRANERLDKAAGKALLGDCFALLPSLIKEQNMKDLILYIDPPFASREGFADIYLQSLRLLEGAKIAIIEHESKAKMPEAAGFELYKCKKFGKSTLSFYRAC